MSMQPPSNPAAKSFVAALLLAFFLGSVGGPDFYLGHMKTGIYKIVLCAVGFILYMIGGVSAAVGATAEGPSGFGIFLIALGGLVLFAAGIWALVTLIQIAMRKGLYATDAQGIPLA